MPQKKNPDVPELIRGKTGRVYGHLQALLTMVKGVPLAYNKDFQEDKEPLFDTVETISSCIKAMTILLDEGIEFNIKKLSLLKIYLNETLTKQMRKQTLYKNLYHLLHQYCFYKSC